MKLAQLIRAGWLIVLAFAASSCAVARVTVDSAAAGSPPTVRETVPVVMQLAFTPEDEEARARQELLEATRALDGTAVFFETGRAELSSEGKVKLRRVAEILRRYPSFRIRIEGNADERGASDYNYALGEKRAYAARDFLVGLEVHPEQVNCISRGETRPLAPSSTEESWKLNRRDDVVPVGDHQ
jgi:peptidoglycan-associated lipoprotein